MSEGARILSARTLMAWASGPSDKLRNHPAPWTVPKLTCDFLSPSGVHVRATTLRGICEAARSRGFRPSCACSGAVAIAVAGCSQERCSKAANGHHPPAERRGSDGFERVLSCAVAYALDPCRRRSSGPSLELFVSFWSVAVVSWRLDMCLPPESGWSCVDVRPSS